jgi:hypothetical protein
VGVIDPAVRIRRKVGVLTEDLIRAHICLELDQEARTANLDVERIECLSLIELIALQVRFAQRRYAKIDEGVAQRLGAESASGERRVGHFRLRDNLALGGQVHFGRLSAHGAAYPFSGRCGMVEQAFALEISATGSG